MAAGKESKMYLEKTPNGNPVVLTNVSKSHLTEKSKKDWLTYWKYFKRNEFNKCAELGCTEQHDHGVLVTQGSLEQGKLFVVPVCKVHGDSANLTLNIDSNVDIIAADLSL